MTVRRQYISHPRQPTFPSGHIIISPIGDIRPDLCRAVEKETTAVFGFPVRTEPLLADISFALDRSRDQYHSTLILEALDAAAPNRSLKILAITREDLFIPILTYVFGEAQLNGRACIVSTKRLAEEITADERGLEKRLVKEAIHELGHTFNLRHCKENNCIMHYCRGVRDVDRKTRDFCRYCRVMLADEIKNLS